MKSYVKIVKLVKINLIHLSIHHSFIHSSNIPCVFLMLLVLVMHHRYSRRRKDTAVDQQLKCSEMHTLKKQRALCGHRKLTRGWYLRDKIQRVMLSEEFWGKEKGIPGKGSSILGSREVIKQTPPPPSTPIDPVSGTLMS